MQRQVAPEMTGRCSALLRVWISKRQARYAVDLLQQGKVYQFAQYCCRAQIPLWNANIVASIFDQIRLFGYYE